MRTTQNIFGQWWSSGAAQRVSRTPDIVEHVFGEHNPSADVLDTEASDGLRQIWVSQEILKWKGTRTVRVSWDENEHRSGSGVGNFIRVLMSKKRWQDRGEIAVHLEYVQSIVRRNNGLLASGAIDSQFCSAQNMSTRRFCEEIISAHGTI